MWIQINNTQIDLEEVRTICFKKEYIEFYFKDTHSFTIGYSVANKEEDEKQLREFLTNAIKQTTYFVKYEYKKPKPAIAEPKNYYNKDDKV